jgi:hypothetical protein
MYNNNGELEKITITLNTDNYMHHCVEPPYEENEVDEKVETQQEKEERQFLE